MANITTGTTLNELTPSTGGVNNQGRLSHVPSDLLPKELVGPIFDATQEHSMILQHGQPIPVGYGDTVISTTLKRPAVGQVGTGTDNAKREGAQVPLSGTAWGTRSFAPIKLGTVITASKEFVRRNPQGLYTQIQRDLPLALGRAVDLAVLHGKNALTGTALVGIDTNNVIANTTNIVNFVETTSTTVYEDLLAGYDLVGSNPNFEFNAWVVDPRFRTTLAREGALRDANGNIDPARIDLSAKMGQVLGLPAHFGRAVGGDLDACADSGLRVIGGDFSQLGYGFADQIEISMSDTATIVDADGNSISMFQTKQVAIMIDVTFGWVLGSKQGFVKFENVATP